MPHDPADDGAQLREELVSYLDGELNAEESRRIEERAALEPDARRMLEELDRTWQMLDALDTPVTSEDFTRTTLEMVALAAAEDVAKAKTEAPRRRLRTGLWAAAGLVAAAAAGFFLVASLLPDPNVQLLKDLPILENFEQYREVDSIEFLRDLNEARLFADDALPPPGLPAVESLSQRRRQVEEMPAEQREELFRSEQQFRALSAEEQKRIRALHAQIEGDPERDKLRATMNRYCKWFETQPPFRRAKLLEKHAPAVAAKPGGAIAAAGKSPEKRLREGRIAMVKEFLAKQGPTKDLRLDDRSRRGLTAWLDHYTTEHGIEEPGPVAPCRWSEVPARSAANRQASARAAASDHPRVSPAALADGRRHRADAHRPARDGSAPRGLSPDLRAKLEAKKPAEQMRIIGDWLRETASEELDDQLADFFERTISDEERDRLMSLSSDEMYTNLSNQYRAHVLKQAKLAEPPHAGDQPHGDRPPWPRGRHPGPRGSAGWHWLDGRDGNDSRTKGNPGADGPEPTKEKPPAKKPPAGKPEKAPPKDPSTLNS